MFGKISIMQDVGGRWPLLISSFVLYLTSSICNELHNSVFGVFLVGFPPLKPPCSKARVKLLI